MEMMNKGKKKPSKLEMLMERGPSKKSSEMDEMELEMSGEDELGAEAEGDDLGMEEMGGEEAMKPDAMAKFSDDELLAELKKRGLGAEDLEMGSEAEGEGGSSIYAGE